MNDNVVEFPGAKEEVKIDPALSAAADEVLQLAVGRYEEVIVIGIKANAAQCITSLALGQTIFELSRAIHKLHDAIDEFDDGE